VKIYVATVGAPRKKERQDEIQETIMCMTKLRVLVLSFADFMQISNVCLLDEFCQWAWNKCNTT